MILLLQSRELYSLAVTYRDPFDTDIRTENESALLGRGFPKLGDVENRLGYHVGRLGS